MVGAGVSARVVLVHDDGGGAAAPVPCLTCSGMSCSGGGPLWLLPSRTAVRGRIWGGGRGGRQQVQAGSAGEREEDQWPVCVGGGMPTGQGKQEVGASTQQLCVWGGGGGGSAGVGSGIWIWSGGGRVGGQRHAQ